MTVEFWEVAAAGCLGATLFALAVIDFRHGILPDVLTLPLLLAGLAVSAWREGGMPADAIVGAAAGYAFFAVVALLYRRFRGREGLGLGDAKLLAAGGAWAGWQALPFIVAVASVAALALLALRGQIVAPHQEVRFGPYLCLGVWLLYLYDASRFGF
jgi:leader peptidase (prepilin peptidase) / N-methyltransferase